MSEDVTRIPLTNLGGGVGAGSPNHDSAPPPEPTDEWQEHMEQADIEFLNNMTEGWPI